MDGAASASESGGKARPGPYSPPIGSRRPCATRLSGYAGPEAWDLLTSSRPRCTALARCAARAKRALSTSGTGARRLLLHGRGGHRMDPAGEKPC